MKISPFFRIFFTFLSFLLIGSFQTINAQNLDSKGTDFWLAFMPNFHNDGVGSRDALYIYIVAEEPTAGEISYQDRFGKVYVANFTISDITQIYTFQLPWTNFELTGYNNNGSILNNNDPKSQNEIITNQAFHVTSQKDVSVYALEQAVTTSEAFLTLPTDALGKEYFVMAYNSDGRAAGINGIDGSSTPSQFLIVATEDSSEITISPKVPTRRFGNAEQQIVLDKGQTYLVQAEISSKAGFQNDFTGSYIKSSKPIAVFGGQQRTKLPVEESALNSRDCVIEQVPPLATWGKSYLLTPYPQPNGVTKVGNDIYRILAAQDSTMIYRNGVQLTTLQRGGVYQSDLTIGSEITSSRPILVAQFKKTSSENTISNFTQYSDPFMMILPPTEQFLPFYRFINAEGYDDDNPNGVYANYEYATIIVPNTAKASVLFDGNPVNQAQFVKIGVSNYSYLHIKTTTGAHAVKCDSAIGLLVYGYGKANSYGYVGGMSYRQINKKMPDLILSNDCFVRKIIAPGVFNGGNRIASITLDPDIPTDNLNVFIPTIPPTRDSVHFTAALRDPYLDGSCGIILTDTLGFTGKTKIDVCGFTVGITSPGAIAAYLPDYYSVASRLTTGRTKRIDADIVNYGKCPVVITSIKTSAGQNGIIDSSSFPPTPFTLDGGARKALRLYLTAKLDGDYLDTISIASSCGSRNILALDVKSRGDTSPPTIFKTGDPCLSTFYAQVSDSLDYDAGLEFAEVIDSVNCSVTPQSPSHESRSFKITVKDPYQDASFAINARDSAGNASIIRDTIPGFTMEFRSLPTNVDPPAIDFGVTSAGVFICDSLDMYNYGAYTLTLNDIALDVNIVFSIPPAQLPLLIPPKESRKLAICYTPVLARKATPYDSVGTSDNDGFGVNFRCLTKRILLKGEPADIYRDGNSRCQLPVYSIADRVAPHYYLESSIPNPAHGIASFGFGVSTAAEVKIVLVDMAGVEQFTILEGHFPEGRFAGRIQTDRLAPGVYFYRMTAGSEIYVQPIIVK